MEQLTAPHRYYDDIYEMEIGTFEGTARFAQNILLTEPEATVKATVEWMICDDSSCMPLTDEELTITVEGRARVGRSHRGCRRADRNSGRRDQGRRGRQRFDLGAHHRGDPLGLRHAADPPACSPWCR